MPTPELAKQPSLKELAPLATSNTIGAMIDPFQKILINQDSVLMLKGAGDFRIYQEVARDDQVKSTFQQRRLAVISKEWCVEPGADDTASQAAADALSANIDSLNWDDITDKMLWAVFYGYGVAEVMWSVGGETGLTDIAGIKVRDRARFRFNVDGLLYLITQDYQFQVMPDRKFWVINTGADNSDNYYGLGLAHYLYWPVFFKRSDIKFWLIFLEKFGQPTAVGKLPAGKENDKGTRDRLMEAVQAIATETGVLIPEGAEISLIEAARSGAADYESMHRVMNEAISKIILSQTMTTDNGSSRSQSETHADVRDMVVAADADLVSESFNMQVVKWWFEYNKAAFPGAKPPLLYRKAKPQKNRKTQAEEDKLISELGYEPTEDYVRETYGEGWVKKQAQPAPGFDQSNKPQPINYADPDFIALKKAALDDDQEAVINAARRLAQDAQGAIGERIAQILAFAEDTEDLESMRQHIIDMLGEQPKDQTVKKLEQATLFSRLMGVFRGQQ